ncbi:hypothetical protein [Maricaulis salignorans]|uniref:hypothetical protein n=1 Tax=Maricaulis salignorans TaxID=144026 RepID=UPI003A8CD36D
MITVLPEAAVAVGEYVGEVFRDPRTQEEQTWDEIIAYTDVSRIGADRLNVDARGGPLAGGGTVDLRVLVRASAETLTQGYSHFAIVHVRDRNMPIAGRLFGTPIYGSETSWIGTYEDFVASRYERDYAAAPRAWLHPGVEVVVLMLNADSRRASRAFNAREVYDSLVVDRS